MSGETVAIFGANGGIGQAFVQHYSNQAEVESVTTFSRAEMRSQSTKINSRIINWDNLDDVESVFNSLEGLKFSRVIVASGILHQDENMPEKQLADLALEYMEQVFRINTFIPALILKNIKPHLDKSQVTKIGILSARVGSISDNRLGGWYTYRASKAALNMLIKSSAIELKRSHKHLTLVGLHPGTVDTHLSKPFQARLKQGQLFTPDYSIAQMSQVLEQVTPEQSGLCFAYDGSVIPA